MALPPASSTTLDSGATQYDLYFPLPTPVRNGCFSDPPDPSWVFIVHHSDDGGKPSACGTHCPIHP
jgi:hypothetical protein